MPGASILERKSTEAKFFLLKRAMIWFQEQIYLQKDMFFLWIPVFVSFGIGVYFSLGVEPPLALGAVAFLFLISLYSLFFRNARSYGAYAFLIFVFVAFGFFISQIRTYSVSTPMLQKDIYMTEVIGTIYAEEELEGEAGQKIVLGDLQIQKLDQDKTPRLIRLSYRSEPRVFVGQRIKVLAGLNVPASPSVPSGFDFRRYMFFQGIGAVGFIYKPAEVISQDNHYSLFSYAESIRQNIADRMMRFLPEREAALIIALTIGKQGGISSEDRDAMRDAGLAHILAISGMNFALVGGLVFFCFRFALACFPYIALYYPIKKISAVAAMVAAVLYLFLTGFTIPAQRAVLSTIVVFLAIMFDRSPFSLRLASFAALVVLTLAPESLLSAGFHMSFAAVIALIVFFDHTRLHWENIFEKRGGNVAGRIVLYFLGVCITTLIGSAATGLYALFHFQRFALLGVVANFVAVPIIAFVITPFSLLALLLSPFGLDWMAYEVLGVAAVQILNVAHWVSDFPLASVQVKSWDYSALIFISLGAVWCVLWKGWGKVAAVPFFAVAVVIIVFSQCPSVFIDSEHKLFGFYDGGQLFVNSKRADQFTRNNWEQYLGLPKGGAQVLKIGAKDGFYFCDVQACRFNVEGKKVSFVKDAYVAQQECAENDIIVMENFKIEDVKGCDRNKSIDRHATKYRGAHVVYFGSGSDPVILVRSADMFVGDRPWSAYQKY